MADPITSTGIWISARMPSMSVEPSIRCRGTEALGIGGENSIVPPWALHRRPAQHDMGSDVGATVLRRKWSNEVPIGGPPKYWAR